MTAVVDVLTVVNSIPQTSELGSSSIGQTSVEPLYILEILVKLWIVYLVRNVKYGVNYKY